MRRGEREKRILKVHLSSNYDNTNIIRKILKIEIQRHRRKSPTVPSGPHFLPKLVSRLPYLGDKYSTLESPLVTFINVIRFISLRSLWWHWWCCNSSFDMPLKYFFIFFSFTRNSFYNFFFWNVTIPFSDKFEIIVSQT
jgi:hypothetical protein